jgi:GTPase SAR1 family protein
MSEKASNKNNIKKMLIMGLDRGGKTSIVLCLKGIKNVASFSSINPTKGIRRETFRAYGSKFNVWDFGGQEQFRTDYIENFNKNIVGTDKIIFVVDIQDNKRYTLALEYLLNVIEKLQESKKAYDIDFSIFLHKYDPDLGITNREFDEQKADAFIEEIKDKIPSNFKFTLAKTSIYTIFQKANIH